MSLLRVLRMITLRAFCWLHAGDIYPASGNRCLELNLSSHSSTTARHGNSNNSTQRHWHRPEELVCDIHSYVVHILQVLQSLSTYKLTPEQAADTSLDLLTGEPLCAAVAALLTSIHMLLCMSCLLCHIPRFLCLPLSSSWPVGLL